MANAVVLSGGGSKGAYQIGVWKALRELDYKYDIVTGTSIGSVNGVLMVQNDYAKAIKLWEKIDFSSVFGSDFNDMSTMEIYKVYAKNFFKNKGMDTTSFYKLLETGYDEKKFYDSKINYGLMTYNASTLKSEPKVKKDIRENLLKYVLASCTCYPIFKKTNIDGKKYLDGGYYDNLPINLAISLGATRIIAVDLKTLGIRRRVKNKNVDITYISPRNDLGPSMFFDKELSEKGMKYGYNDAMKEMHELDGDKYTFEKGNIFENYSQVKQKYVNLVNEVYKSANLKSNSIKKDLKNIINESLEYLGKITQMDDTKIYSIKEYNKEIKKRVNEVSDDDIEKKKTIKNIYDKINSKDYTNYDIILYTKLFRKELLCALYLMVI